MVGCGLMGSGIAEVSARAGLDVVVREVDAGAVEAGQRRVTTSLDRGVRSGKLTEEDRDAALSRIGWTTDLADLADRDLVVEAVVEDEGLKTEVFATLDKVVDSSRAILASNTSSIPIMKLGMATSRPEQVVGIHFFNPVPVLRLVEVVTSLLTSPETTERASTFATDVLHKRVIRSQDRAGFIVNALLVPYLLSAIRMLESGFASPEDIDIGMVEGCNHPMGPLRLTDLIGLDTTMAVADSLYTEFKEPLYASPPLLSRMVEAGLLGRKAGRGFYDYAKCMTDRVLVAKVGLDGHDRGREGGGPHAARRRLRGHLHRSVPDARHGGRGGRRRGRRCHRTVDAVRRPHDAGAQGGREGARPWRRHPGHRRGDHPGARRAPPEDAGCRRGPDPRRHRGRRGQDGARGHRAFTGGAVRRAPARKPAQPNP